MLHAEENNGKKEREQERKRAHSRFQRAPDNDSPLAAREMLQHQEGERAEGQSENEHETHQIGLVESSWEFHGANNGKHQCDAAHEERALLQEADAFRRPIFLRSHQYPPPGVSFALPDSGLCSSPPARPEDPPWRNFSRRSAGSSATFALRLSWRART